MEKNKTVLIKGRRYDAVTGLPVQSRSHHDISKTQSSAVHSPTQKTKTLARRIAKKPTPTARVVSDVRRPAPRSTDIARSSQVSKFAPQTASLVKKQPVIHTVPDIGPRPHPIAQKAKQAIAQKSIPHIEQKTAQEMKNEALQAALAKPSTSNAPLKNTFRIGKRPAIMILVAVLVIAAGVVSYISFPSISVQIAATRAGIKATYPQYHPDGYHIDGPVTYSDGKVVINYKANTGSSSFVLTQAESSWDSSAVLDNIVRTKVKEEYLTNQEQGLTIYTFKGNAAWVNGGILYTIEGDAPLTGEQLRKIATSL